jgi:hypothetical protein
VNCDREASYVAGLWPLCSTADACRYLDHDGLNTVTRGEIKSVQDGTCIVPFTHVMVVLDR